MFEQFLTNQNLSFEEEKKFLKKILDEDVKTNPTGVLQQIQKNHQKWRGLLKKHWKLSSMICMQLLSKELAFQYLQQKQNSVVLNLLEELSSHKDNERAKFIIKLYEKFSDPWKCLVILKIISKFFASAISTQHYGFLLANFIRVSALIIQNYLNIKNQPTKFQEDRTQYDLLLVKNCQKWVGSSYLLLFKNLQKLDSHKIKITVFNGLSQMMGALIESLRQNILQKDILESIVQEILNYSFRNYSLHEINLQFIESLKKKRYENPVKKVDIPQSYNEEQLVQTSGFCFFVLSYVKKGRETASIQSASKTLAYILIALSESCPLPYQYRQQLIQEAKRVIDSHQGLIHFNQLQEQYPLGLFFFHLFHYEPSQFSYFSKSLSFDHHPSLKVNQLRVLYQINIENLNVEKGIFIVDQLKNQCFQTVESLYFIKNLHFDFSNQNYGQALEHLFELILKAHPEKGRKVIYEKIKQQVELKNNLALCQKLESLIAK